MNNNEFYSPIKSLVNLILTGEKEISQDGESIPITQEFVDSIVNEDDDFYNLHYLNCIALFLDECESQERIDIMKIYNENIIFIFGTLILNGQLMDAAITEDKDVHTILDEIFSDYVIYKRLQPTLCLAIYFYIENLSKIEFKDRLISRFEYEKFIQYNSIKRVIDGDIDIDIEA